jgi:XTP/dITP diphosphohydrolase
MDLVCATANPGKVAEIEKFLPAGVRLLPRPSEVGDVVEDARTLEGNARLKAQAIVRSTGKPALADDTGLEVQALNGGPGVETAYFAGPQATDAENRAKLLRELNGVTDRRARFVTVMLVARPDGRELVVQGVCEGTIALVERGQHGFGFDPVFVPDDGDGRTFAEMTAEEKNAVSHRGRALRALGDALTATP